ncbi:hypothetical protein XELAEV_18037867mg [Xenopus laevis]|uniref:GIY-YIG domain-containing protein n=1 Tax=Xenopus laevis TaxID=8355 RepID=A0A974HAK1_XENLA|nr:hypothetical protein XELAEV_18037867mg [Xenopus laevis]
MLGMFRKKGYPKSILQKAEKEVDALSRETVLTNKKNDTQMERIPSVTTFDVHSKRVRKVIRKYWPILMNDSSTSRVFKGYPLFAYKRDIQPPKTAKQRFLGKTVVGTFPCLSCQNFNRVIKRDTVLHPTQGTQIKLRGYHTCMSKNLIYYLKCPWGKGYVGKTNRMIRLRLNEHRSAIRNAHSQMTSVSRHWTECKHNVAQLRWQVLEEVKANYTNIDKKLLQRECFSIWKLDTLSPKGMNENWGLNCFL